MEVHWFRVDRGFKRIRIDNKQVFSSLEFVNILLQIEAKAVKNVSSLV